MRGSVALALALAAGRAGAEDATPAEAPPEAAFADALFAEGDYYRAIGEYKRALHLHPDSPRSGEWLLRIGEAYLKGGQEKEAADHFDRLGSTRPDVARRARLEAARAHLRAGAAATAEGELKLWLEAPDPDPGTASSDARRLLGWALLKQEKDAQAADAFSAAGAASLADRTRALSKLPYKDPILAGALSIVPGLGHLYIDEPAVALAALAWNALFAWATWDAWRRGDAGTAAVLLTFESIWYGGAIVGAVGGAFRYNRDLRRNAVEEMEKDEGPPAK